MTTPEHKLSEEEQQKVVDAITAEKKMFADTYKRWLDSAGKKKKVDPNECMFGMCN